MTDQHDLETGEVPENRFYREAGSTVPPTIAAAIVAVKKQVKQLGSDERNEHGRYGYVSVDKFYEVIGRLMAEQGLALLIDETASDVREGKSGNPWLFLQFSLTFMHESGALFGGLRRSIALPISGPQAYGAAQSYIEKQFLRQVFKVPTGEKDADETAPAGGAPGGRPAQGTGAVPPPPGRAPQAAPAFSEVQLDAKKRVVELRAMIDGAERTADLDGIDGCPAWVACEQRIHEGAEGSPRQNEIVRTVMDSLRRRILDKRAQLLATDDLGRLNQEEY